MKEKKEEEFKIVDKRKIKEDNSVDVKDVREDVKEKVESQTEKIISQPPDIEKGTDKGTDKDKDKEIKKEKNNVILDDKGVPEDAVVLDPGLLGASYSSLDICRIVLTMFVTNTVVNLGLVPNPQDKQQKRDMKQAKLSLDCLDAIFKVIENELPELEKKQTRSTIAELKIQFVNQKKIIN
jgi:hypothetical protein